MKKTRTTPAPIKTTKTPPDDQVPVDGERFQVLWMQFEEEAGFSTGKLEEERNKLQEEILELESKIEEKKRSFDLIERRVDAAKNQMRALFEARLSDDAILSAMRVEYKVRRAIPRGKKPAETGSLSDADKELVLDQLDAEGLSVTELKTLTGKEPRFLRATLEALVIEGKASKTGEGASAKYHLV